MKIIALTLALLGVAANAAAHGVNGHVHVTGWAIERLPPGELRDFFADPEVRDAALIGASFPDSGYAINDGYGELAHWEPYVSVHLAWLRERFAPPFESLEARKQVAFLMGLAAHGLQDELFDSVFLYQVQEHDQEDQERSDPGTDAFLFTDGWLQYKPPLYAPFDDLPAIFLRAHNHVVTPATIRAGMNRVKLLVIDGFAALAPGLDAQHRPFLPWTSQHYVDPAVPGSLAAEIPATGAHLQALWDRLHGRFGLAGLPVHTWPDAPRRLRGRDPASVDAWITVVFGAGVRVGSLTPETVRLLDPDGQPVPVVVRGTRWGGNPEDSSRIVRIQPTVALAPNAVYTVRLAPGVETLEGQTLEEPWTFQVLTPCDDGDMSCPPEPQGGEPPRPPLPPDAGVDAGVVDAGVADAAVDARPHPDLAAPDANAPDAARPDATAPDAARPEATPDADRADAAPTAIGGGSDGCQTSGSGRSGVLWGVLALGFVRRRRIGKRL